MTINVCHDRIRTCANLRLACVDMTSINTFVNQLKDQENKINNLMEENAKHVQKIEELEKILNDNKKAMGDSQNSSMSQDTDADGSKYANENVAAFQKLSEQLSLIEKSLKENADTKTKDIKKIDDASKNIIKHLQKMETDYNEIVDELNETTNFNKGFLDQILHTKLSSSEQEKEIQDINRQLIQEREHNKKIVHTFTGEIHEQIKELNKLIEEEMKVDKSAREKAQLESLNKQILTVKNRTDDITRLNEEIRMRFVPDLAKTLVEIIERIFQKNQAAKN